MATKLDELNVTPEELERFKAAFQDSRFRELFAEYAQEISDPENRRRYEQEICEMERERGIDIQFVHPEPGHVLHTSRNGQHSCFLNVCSNNLIQRPNAVQGSDMEGRPGYHWVLPCSLSPAREMLNSDGGLEIVYDVIFHPDTLRLAAGNDKFKAMVDLTALQMVAQSFKVLLDNANVRTTGEKYRGVPQACVIRRPRPGAKPKPQDPNDPLRFPYPYGVPGGRKKTGRVHPKPQPPPVQTNTCQEPTIPRYTIRHRSYVDMQDYMNSRYAAPSPVPKELVITVYLPLLSMGSNINLHIESKALSLESKKPAYKLQLKLPYVVDMMRGNAQFNKIKRQLVVVVPVVQQDVQTLMENQLADVPGAESKLCPSHNPDTQASGDTQATGDTQASGKASEIPSSGEDPTKVGEPVVNKNIIHPLPKVCPECPIFTCSQDATTLTLVIHVKDIDEHSISSEVGSYQCEIRFCVKLTDAPYVLFVKFLPQYNLNTNDIAVKVSEDNMVIELTKSSECFGLWKNLFFGVNGNCLQERRFVNEDNVAEFLQSSLRPSTIPWSTQADPPMIHVLQMNNRRTHIQLNKPELEKESNLAHRERFADLKKQISYPSEEAEPSDTGRDDTSPQDSDDNEENQGGQLELQTKNPAECTCPEQREDNGAEDKAPNLKDIPTNELDEDDLPNVTKATQGLDLQNSEPRPVLKEVDSKANDTSDHKTQCAFRFENSLLFELD